MSVIETSIESLLGRLRALDIRLWVEGEDLRFSAPKGALTPDLRAELKARKPEVIAFLQAARRDGAAPADDLRPVPRDPAGLPLSFSQARLWFLEQLGTLGAAYNMPLGLRLGGDLDVAALSAALDALLERHEALRAAFAAVDGEPRQFVRPPPQGLLARSDLSGLPPERREAELERLTAAESERPFDLSAGPLLRARLVRLEPREHVLLTVFHHIACDGWSIGVFTRELSALYAAFRAGRPSPLPPLPIQYADYAAWQQGRDLQDQLAYWSRRLRDLPPLELPADRPRQSVQGFRGAGRSGRLEPSLIEALTDLGRRQGASLFMVTLAAFHLLMARLADQERLGVGIPIANRNRGETEGLIGFFVNSLVIDADLSDDPDFVTLLQRVRDATLAAFDRQDLPFDRLVQELQPERSLGRNPLFQVAFALQQAEAMAPRFDLPGLAVAPYGRSEASTRVDLELHLWPAAGGLDAFCTYDRDLFEAETIDRLLARYERLLRAVVAEPRLPASRLPLLDPAERRQLIEGVNDSGPAPRAEGLAAAFAAQAARTPNHPALEDGAGRQITYRDLAADSEKLAQRLTAAGVGRETPVALAFERGPAAVVAMLAVLRAGGAFVPLDLRHPPERLRGLLADCGATLLLCEGEIDFAAAPVRVLRLDEEGAEGTLPPLPGPEQLGYILYTSGSTGQPKGVAIEQGGVVQLARAQIADFAVGPDSRVLQFASPAFDAAVSEVFMALLSGACLCLAPREALLPGPDLLATLRERRITVVTLPPTALAAMAADGLPDLATLASAGEACSAELLQRWARGRRFLNAYGPTEVTVCATEAVVEARSEGPPPIGRPLPGKTAYVLDPNLEPVPFGQPGELFIGGFGLARGYLGRPGATAERFLPDPFSAVPGARLFRSGDRVRRRIDGSLEYLGRLDRQVKLRGQRIEPEEIEAVLKAHPAVAEAAVTFSRDDRGEPRLVAHYAARSPSSDPANRPVELWPSVAEFFVYDDLLYYALANDERRNRAYREAYGRKVRDRVVLDVGTGGEAIQARLCIEAGARHVYAVELLRPSYEKAVATVQRLGLADRITVIHGDARSLTLPEPVEVVVSEIVGSLGGSEGCVPILNAVRPLLVAGGCMVPARSLTKIAALELPRAFLDAPAFAETGAHYAERIFAEAGRRFDLRLCLRHLGPEALLSEPAVFEDLDFSGMPAASNEHRLRLEVRRPGLLSGLLAWLTLELDEDATLDTLAEEHSWLPVWFPLFWPGVTVEAGAVIEMTVSRQLSPNGLNPDYRLRGRLIQRDGSTLDFDHASLHQPEGVGGTELHRRLFGAERLPVTGPAVTGPAELRRHAARLLPEAMVPSAFVSLTALPLNVSGKIDRAALVAFERPLKQLSPTAAERQRREIEARLLARPEVREVALLADPEGWRAYVAATAALPAASRQVEAWRDLYEDLHARPEAEAEFHGWTSALTGAAIPPQEMAAWAEETAARILDLKPQRLLEIGCGTGILLRRLAAHCRYHGTDLSPSAVARARASLPEGLEAHLEVRAADDFDGLPQGTFDCVVINSVAQYFPNETYLLRVLEGAWRLLAPGGRLFLGDIRHHGLAAAFQALAERTAAPPGTDAAALRAGLLRRLEEEEELLVDPAWFANLPERLPGAGAVRLLLKRGPLHNELAAWRYDAVLEKAPATDEPEPRQLDWCAASLTPESLSALLRRERPARLLLTGVPDARVAAGLRLLERITTPQDAVPEDPEALDPEALWALAHAAGYGAAAAPDPARPGRFDLLLLAGEDRPKPPLARPLATAPDEPLVNGPLAARGRRALAAALQAELAEHLPEPVLPLGLRVLAALPRRADGTLDEGRLSAVERRPTAANASAAPRNPAEARLAELWAEVLGLPAVGIHDSFFELGGHSLLGTQLVARVTQALGVEAPVRLLFEAPSVAAFGARLDGLQQEEGPTPSGAGPNRGEDLDDLPLSYAQARLWFLGRLVPDDPFYNVPLVLRLKGLLDRPALHRALTALAERHEALRTRITAAAGEPRQQILPPAPVEPLLLDLAALPAPAREREARRLAGEAARRPFATAEGSLLRVELLRLSDSDHVLVLVLHHLVSDGWSNGILLRDLGAAYRSALAGGATTLPQPPLRYADYAGWQRDRLEGPATAAQLDYWRGQLEGLPPLALPTDRPRPALQDFRGASLPLELPAELNAALTAFARQEGATLFMLLLAAFQALLGRSAGQDDLAVGTPVAGRSRPEFEEVVGLFVNTLVLRADLAGDPTPRALLARTRETALAAFAHQELPFDRLVQELNPSRDLGRNPLFQVMFALQNAPAPPAALAGLTLEPLGHDNHATRFDLELSVWERDGRLQGALTYATALFDQAGMAALLNRWRLVLEGFVAAPDRPLGEIPLLLPAERETVLRRGARRAGFAPAGTIHERVAAQAALRPEAPAVGRAEAAGVTWTSYGELEAASERLARRLRAVGVGPDSIVGLCLERGPQAVVGILGILKAGGAYLALDPAYPAERLDYLIADSGLRVVVAEQATATALPTGAAHLLLLEDEAEAVQAEAPLPTVRPENLAYVIYTSGSTGRPKGVAVTHHNVLRLFEATREDLDFGPDDVWSLFHSLSFDFSVWELWGALFHGGRVVVVPEEIRRSPEAFHELLASAGVTVLNQTPSAFRQLDRTDAARKEARLQSLRWVIFGGEALEPASLRGWFARHGDDRPRLVNMYGITETTVHVTRRRVTAADAEAGSGSPIGGAIGDLSLHLLDAALEPVPDGVPGQLFVGGDGLARGYLGRPALTAERMIPDPFSGQPGARLYATGDLARRRRDGEIEYLGRIDQQVKLRGHRIELGEITAALLEQPELAEAVVLLQGEGEDDRRLVAWAVPREAGASPSTAALLARLRERLPPYMVPAALVLLDALPLTANGKLDRAALPAPGRDDRAGRAFLAPGRGLEEQIAALWRDLLGVEQVGAEDNFFDLGGHSLLVPRLQQALDSRLGRQVGIVELFRFPTVRSLATHLEQEIQPEAGAGEAAAGEEGRRQGRARLQRRRAGDAPS